MTKTPITLHHNTDRHRLEAHVEGQVAGFVDYVEGEGTLTLAHTEVDAAFGGQGVGGGLAAGALGLARDRGVKVVPECPFIRSYMSKHEETHDLLAPDATLEG